MVKKTPTLYSKGTYVLKAPWSADPNVQYRCVAIRGFADIYKLGKDVYETYYASMGVTNGSTQYTGSPFVFADEKTNDVNIITLLSDTGNTLYVPDTFIDKYPDVTLVQYSHIVLAASIYAIPDTVDLTAVKTSIANYITDALGVIPVVQEVRAPSYSTPTTLEHGVLETNRLAAITMSETDRAKSLRLEQQNVLLQGQVNSLLAILRTNNLLPT